MARRPWIPSLALAAAALATGCFDWDLPERAEADCFEESSNTCWQRISPYESMYWEDAIDYCDTMSIGGYAWHLPDIDELRTLVAGCDETEEGGSCDVSEEDECLDDDCGAENCGGCTPGDGDGYDGCFWDEELEGDCDSYSCYWSSSDYDDYSSSAWVVSFYSGAVVPFDKYSYCYVRCVAEDE